MRRRSAQWQNWGRTASCSPAEVVRPRSEDELHATIERVRGRDQTIKAVGAGHSFPDIACTDAVMVSLDRLQTDIRFDSSANTVTVSGGMTLKALNELLAGFGSAMTNLGDIAYQSVAGALSTGTHGTGVTFGGLATQLRGLRLVTATGRVIACDREREADIFDVARVGLGALGIISEATIAVEPAFRLHAIEEPRPIDEILDGWIETVESNDHFEFFWMPGARRAMTKTNRRTDDPADPLPRAIYFREKILGENIGFGALCRVGSRWPTQVPRFAKLISNTPTRLEYIDESYKVFASPRWVRFAEMEYSIPLDALPNVVRAIADGVQRLGIDLLFPIEARAAAADDIPLSTSHGRRSAYVAVHRFAGRPYREYFEMVEAVCADNEGRPHWGKLHFQSAETLAPRYPRWQDFIAVRDRLDPDRVFANTYLDRVLGP